MADRIYKVRDPTGTIREIRGPEGAADDEVIAQAQKLFGGTQPATPTSDPYSATNIAGAAIEPNLSLLSGAAAAPISGLAGLATGAGNALGVTDRNPADVVRSVGSALTYQPKTAGGQTAMGVIGAPFQKLAEGADYAGGKVTDVTGSPLLGTVANTAIQMAPALFGKNFKAVDLAIKAGEYVSKTLGDVGSVVGASFGNQAGIERLARGGAQRVAGDTKAAQIAALRNATEYVPGVKPTAAEAIAEANMGKPEQFGGATIRLQKDLSGAQGAEDILPSAARQQQVALEAPVIKMAGGNTAQERAQALASAAALRNEITTPMRETALTNANIAGIKVPELQRRIAERAAGAENAVANVRQFSNAGQTAQNLAHSGTMRLDSGVPPIPGLSRIPERYGYGSELANIAERKAGESADVSLQRGAERRFAEMQLGSLEAHGLKPLDASSITGPINRLLSTPGERAVTLNEKVLTAVRDKINEMAGRNNGQLDAHDLYAIRKTEINDVVKTLTKDSDASTKVHAATLANSIKSHIDTAIESAGGTGWKDYLAKYSDLSNKMDQMKVAGAILERMRSDTGRATPSSLLKVLGSGEDALLKRNLGGPRATEIEQVFPAEKAKQLRNIEAHMLRSEEANRIASGVKASNAGGLASGEIPMAPTLLSRPMMLANFLLNLGKSGANSPVAKYVAQQMRDPQAYAKLLQENAGTSAPMTDAARRAALASMLYQQGQQP